MGSSGPDLQCMAVTMQRGWPAQPGPEQFHRPEPHFHTGLPGTERRHLPQRLPPRSAASVAHASRLTDGVAALCSLAKVWPGRACVVHKGS